MHAIKNATDGSDAERARRTVAMKGAPSGRLAFFDGVSSPFSASGGRVGATPPVFANLRARTRPRCSGIHAAEPSTRAFQGFLLLSRHFVASWKSIAPSPGFDLGPD